MTDAQRWVKEIFGDSMTSDRWRQFKAWFQVREHRLQFLRVMDLPPRVH